MPIKPRLIYVLGHTRPDTDSICSAIAYAHLKQQLGFTNVRAGRAGPINPQTRYVLSRFVVGEPELVEDLHVRVADLIDRRPITVPASTPLREVGDLMRTRQVKTLPVVDSRNRLLGILTVGDLAQKYLEEISQDDPVQAGRQIQQLLAQPVSCIMRTDSLVFFVADDLLGDARRLMLETRYRNYPVVDEDYRLLGLISRYHLLAFSRKQVILVDHNEKGQAVPGIEEAEILEIIDHHRLGDLQTGEPIYVRSEPVGSTCTLVAAMFFENGLTPAPEVAGLLCAGILSDTVIFKSPTCTDRDRQLAQSMARVAGVDPEALGREMFRAAVDLDGRSAEDLFYEDFKEFFLGDERVGISQIEVMGLDVLEPLKDSLRDVLEKARQYAGYDLVVLMVTDLLSEGTELLVEGKNPTRIAQAFRDYSGVNVETGVWAEKEDQSGRLRESDSVFLPGVISRKKQVVPVLVKFLGNQKR